MQTGQRAVLIIALVFLVFFGIWIPSQKREERFVQQWEKLQTERFLNKVVESGKCTYEEVMMFYDALNYDGISTELELKEFQEEQNRYGDSYWYLVSWNEILTSLMEEGVYFFRKGSVLELSVKRNNGTTETKYRYCDIVF